ncbi:MAG: M2 family metallopeptidase [Chloroflexales bacterium]|nr:M2 family metallopeptidase [Chloroflexales bacterium]
MESDVQAFVDRIAVEIRPLWTGRAAANWGLATTGEERYQRELRDYSEQAMLRFARADEWQQVREWHARRHELGDPLLRRQLELLYLRYAGNQQPPEQIARIAALQAELSTLYTIFRSTLGGQQLPENTLKDMLRSENDVELRQEAWEATKQIGPVAAPVLLELVEARNAGARAMGWRDYYAMALELQEVDEAELFALLDELEEATREPFARRKATIDAALAARYGSEPGAMFPWHYSDPFFQEPPHTGAVDLDAIFAGQDVEALTVSTFDGLGLEIRPILARSDMWERPGKDQHAFCTHIDRAGDVRVLCNLRPDARWMETSLHEFGHAVYDAYLAPELPYLLRTPAHTNTTEAVAMLMGRLARDAAWLRQVRGLSADEAAVLAEPASAEERTKQLVFVRWALVMTHFERALYADPRRPDLNALWWDLVERFQLVRRPPGRDAPDWATKLHLAVAPVYYHNYMLGELTASQLRATIGRAVPGGELVNSSAAGAFLRDRLFALGAQHPWNDALALLSGERLTPRYFAQDFVV